jgi:hypothetical protein
MAPESIVRGLISILMNSEHRQGSFGHLVHYDNSEKKYVPESSCNRIRYGFICSVTRSVRHDCRPLESSRHDMALQERAERKGEDNPADILGMPRTGLDLGSMQPRQVSSTGR